MRALRFHYDKEYEVFSHKRRSGAVALLCAHGLGKVMEMRPGIRHLWITLSRTPIRGSNVLQCVFLEQSRRFNINYIKCAGWEFTIHYGVADLLQRRGIKYGDTFWAAFEYE